MKIERATNPSKIVCVGRNYAEHAKELGNEVPTAPLLFLKAPSAIISHGDEIVIPRQSNQVEHEGELGVVIGRDCKNVRDDEDPFQYVLGYTCMNDVTARDVQRGDVQFTRGKSFDTFCPVGPHIETELDVSDIRVTTTVNGVIKQDADLKEMIWPCDDIVAHLSGLFELMPGDLIYTGTPAGVGKIGPGDRIEGGVEGVDSLTLSIL